MGGGPSNLSIPKFTGSFSMPIETWSRIIKITLSASNVSKQVAISKIVNAVQEPYLSTLFIILDEDISGNKNMTINQIVDEFVSQISTANMNQALYTFQNAKQRPQEKAFDYGLHLKKIAAGCFKGINKDMVDKLVLHRFLEGVNQPLKRELAISMPKDLSEAMSSSIILEGNSRRLDPTVANMVRQEPPIMHKKETKLPKYSGPRLPITRNIDPNRKFEKTGRNSFERRDKVQAIDLEQVMCWKCRKNGHMSRDCPQNSKNWAPKASNDTGQTATSGVSRRA